MKRQHSIYTQQVSICNVKNLPNLIYLEIIIVYRKLTLTLNVSWMDATFLVLKWFIHKTWRDPIITVGLTNTFMGILLWPFFCSIQGHFIHIENNLQSQMYCLITFRHLSVNFIINKRTYVCLVCCEYTYWLFPLPNMKPVSAYFFDFAQCRLHYTLTPY